VWPINVDKKYNNIYYLTIISLVDSRKFIQLYFTRNATRWALDTFVGFDDEMS